MQRDGGFAHGGPMGGPGGYGSCAGGGHGGRERMDVPPMLRGGCGDGGAPFYRPPADLRRTGFSDRGPPMHPMMGGGGGGMPPHCYGQPPHCGPQPPGLCAPPGSSAGRGGSMPLPPDGRRQQFNAQGPHGPNGNYY
jgi:hypothetical protein